ncbi:group II truncated hemoglobin [Novosphingobium aerophilum]|uniref:group II truncated hemoglobin n=1 Tax=Novosphingobium TaxID=165696 RepID=UPI0012CF7A61|nr:MULTISPECIES: group II truncated hemoglobin [unclassified Novosphingobium]MPS70989.1 globin [Novosphingobium sp.]WRT92537.1 group II truncated hemoglobin [Novosphingobium sp. RL4]
MTETTLYDRIGGAPTIDALVDSFYARMDELDAARTIRAMHPQDLAPLGQVLKDYLSEWLGGPALFSPVRGHPRMRQRHMRVPIDSAARDAWLLCMRGALAQTVADEAARSAIDDAMARLADWMRNVPDEPAAETTISQN